MPWVARSISRCPPLKGATSGITTTAPNTNGILGAYLTVSGSNWAASSAGALNNGAAYNIVPYSAYTFTSSLGTLTSAGTLNVSISAANSLTNSVTLYTLNLTGGADVSIGSGNPTITLLGGGLIGNTSNGSNGITSGGTLEGSPSGELVVITPQNLTISSVIANNGGATALTKTGPATLILSGINTYSGATTVAAGVLQISNTAAFGQFHIH